MCGIHARYLVGTLMIFWGSLFSQTVLASANQKDDNVSIYLSSQHLLEARANFKTNIVRPRAKEDKPDMPPKAIFSLIQYPSEVGLLSAYLTPAPKNNEKLPAVIWVQGGFGGISNVWDSEPRSNDQTGSAFRKAGFVLMVPSFRGENDNPGTDEMFYGDIKDIQAARDYLAKQPYVDENRIYLVGHSTGGTRVLLASEMTTGFRAFFSLGGVPYIAEWWGDNVSFLPFDTDDFNEYILRSPGYFIGSIKTATFNFEGGQYYNEKFDALQYYAESVNVPFQSYQIKNGNHFSIITPVTELIVEKILNDTGEVTNIQFDNNDIDQIENAIYQ